MEPSVDSADPKSQRLYLVATAAGEQGNSNPHPHSLPHFSHLHSRERSPGGGVWGESLPTIMVTAPSNSHLSSLSRETDAAPPSHPRIRALGFSAMERTKDFTEAAELWECLLQV